MVSNSPNLPTWPDLLSIPEFAQMRQTPQDPRWHAEGDVGTHTQMVLGCLQNLPEFTHCSLEEQELLVWAAAFHDIGKIVTTRVDENSITSRGHAKAGVDIAAQIMAREGHTHFTPRHQDLFGLIAMHGRPPFLFQGTPQYSNYPAEAHIISCSQSCPLKLLNLLVKADTLGRKGPKPTAVLETLELMETEARNLQCWEQPYPFPSAYARYKFLNDLQGNYRYTAFDATKFEVTLMVGLPASGKTSTRSQLNLPVISLDEIRQELHLDPGDSSAPVLVTAKERLKECLRKHQDCIWDATNLRRDIREGIISLVHSYSGRVHIVYHDQDVVTCVQRDRKRERPVGEKVIEAMAARLQPPLVAESESISYLHSHDR